MKKPSLDQFINKSNIFHQSKYDYSLVTAEQIEENYYIKVICPVHGEFEQLPTSHHKRGCLKCFDPKAKTKEEFIKESHIIHESAYDYSKVRYDGQFEKVSIVCDKHGTYNIFPDTHLFEKRGCSKCSVQSSKNKNMWLDNVIELSDSPNNRNVLIKEDGFKYLADGFDPKKSTVYEYLKDYWSGNIKAYPPNSIHPDLKITYQELFDYYENKRIELRNLGYQVVTIYESEFLESQKNNNKIIIHDNKHAQYITADIKRFNKLKQLLSFKEPGVEYTAAFKNGWSGIQYLIDDKGYFLSGLLQKVKSFLDGNQVDYTIIDKRIAPSISKEIDLSSKMKSLGFEVREYQQRMVDAALSKNKGIVRATTGSGKTLTTAIITAKLNKPTIIYVIGLDLLKQFHDLYSQLFDEPIGYIGNGTCEIHRITIASIWSIGSALKVKKVFSDDEVGDKEKSPSEIQSKNILKMLSEARVHIFDESHVVTTDTIKDIFAKINAEHLYGFSGTPFRDDGSDLLINGILGEQIVNVSASELISLGYLAQPVIKFVRVPKNYQGTGTSNYQTVYKEYISENIIRNNLIVDNAKQLLSKNYQVLVLFKNLQHGKALKELFDIEGIPYEYLSGTDSMDKRTAAKDNLLSHKSNLVLASTIFDIGVDIPSLSALVLAGGGKSSIRALQRVGRVIRKYSGKKVAAIVDFYDDVKFLKAHSKRRHFIYSTENGFKIIVPQSLQKELNGITNGY